jgi:very-short-patch-repair endonuclease/succinate dehydrogenase flavin-adding protein (antitoxin of CptAB toxin-antitoxin module)
MSDSKTSFAKYLRSNMTDAERLLWRHLRSHRLQGAKFKRQQPLGKYIVDFVSFAHHLVLEVDGGQHLESRTDAVRDAWLQTEGFQILRFWNNDVLVETDAVLEKIYQVLTPSPQPSPTRGEGAASLHVSNITPDYLIEADNSAQNPSPLVGEGQGRGVKNLERIRWRCRRGLLELDIVLGRFVEAHYAGLDAAQEAAFDALLDSPDTVLWDMITGRQDAAESLQQAVLAQIKMV